MMMSRPSAKPSGGSKVTPAVEDTTSTTVPKTSHEHVQDLERRLAMLGDAKQTPPPETKEQEPPPPPPPPFAAPSQKSTAAPETLKAGGKTALLARIMAAQEKAKAAASSKPRTEAPKDLLDDDSIEPTMEPPPPAFDEAVLPPPPAALTEQEPPPPPFEALEQQEQDPPPSFETIEQQQPPPAFTAPPAPMAPAYEDLLDVQPLLETIEPMQAPMSTVDEEIMGMEGLSEEERHALIEEQRQIMAQIENEKAANAAAIAAAAADAFDQRSAPAVAQVASNGPPRVAMPSPALSGLHEDTSRTVDVGGGQQVALHGQERTREAIANGTAILVQCIHCQNWMQVTDTAALMFCPVCSVVSPVERQSAVLTKEEAMQLTADRRMAEQLQNEEYADQEEEEAEEETWWGAFTGIFSSSKKPDATAAAQPQQVAPAHRGDIGVARPPGSPERGVLVAARTGAGEHIETISFSHSQEESEGLLLQSNSDMPKARVAERQPLFSCVVDSVSTAASSLGSALTSTTLAEDQEGNVHGVDASSLLAVTRASRGQVNEEYEPLNNP